MKKLLTALLLTAVLAGGGCTKDSSPADEQGQGQVIFTISSSDQVASSDADQMRTAGQRQIPWAYVPDPDDFTLKITTASGDLVSIYEKLSDYNQPLLDHGDYKAYLSYGSQQVEGAAACFFEGAVEFKVIARKTSSVSLMASLSNSILSLTTSDWFRRYYTSATLTIRTETGYSTGYTIKNGGQQPGADAISFIAPNSKIYLSGTAKKTNGVEVKFPETQIGTTAKRTWHTVNVDMSSAGQLSLSVILDDTMTEIPEEIELNPEA